MFQMHQIKGKDANELYINIARKMLVDGEIRSPRNKKTLELKHAFLTLEDITQPVVTLKSRNIDLNYLKGEMDWYLNGSYNVNEIEKYSKFWHNLQDNNGKVNSNYGQIALRERINGLTQYEWCFYRLFEDPKTRQAVINFNQPHHKKLGNKDFVCTMYQQFDINKNNKLDSFVSMRSNDLIYGLTYDLPWFTYLQNKMAENLKLEGGEYTHHAVSLHVYKKHFKMLENIANEIVK